MINVDVIGAKVAEALTLPCLHRLIKVENEMDCSVLPDYGGS